ncbi:hypothetical protein B296_00049669 [Ensete ventricosum]|uniref:Protein kinase domain-containing protein n=1 Tax=Ensete ventricosum TaxID=4639 RepID=A0A426YL48_ENSVE|nr:hypothetical protein B296_00049669 [Ensete ventricosum]
METQWMAEFPHAATDKRPRKRPRLTWDVPPQIPPAMVLLPLCSSPRSLLSIFSSLRPFLELSLLSVPVTLYCGKEAAHIAGANQLLQSFYDGGVPRYASPPWRGDNKDGHYIFSIGDNLTPRYRILSKMGEDYHTHICVTVMHELRLIHTDLKPENILLVSSEYVKVPDYKVL